MPESDTDRHDGAKPRPSSPPSPLDGPPKRVDVSSIEQELVRLWQATGEGGGQAVTRACALNLVVHVEGETAAERASETIAHVATHDPNRAIVVVAESAAESGLDTWISAHCFLPGADSPQVCCEQITISARGDAVEQAPGLVLPLLVADLPVVLWWVGDPPLGSDDFRALCRRRPPRHPRLRELRRPVRPPQDPLRDGQRAPSPGDQRPQLGSADDAPRADRAVLRRAGDARLSRRCDFGESWSTPTERASRTIRQAALLLGWLGSRLDWRIAPGQPRPASVRTPDSWRLTAPRSRPSSCPPTARTSSLAPSSD